MSSQNWLGAPSMMEPISIPGTRTSVRGYRRVRGLVRTVASDDYGDLWFGEMRMDLADSPIQDAMWWAYDWHEWNRKNRKPDRSALDLSRDELIAEARQCA